MKFECCVILLAFNIYLPNLTFSQVLNAEAFKSQEARTDSFQGQFTFGLTADQQRSLIYSVFSDVDMTFKIYSKSLLTAGRFRVTGTSEQMLLNGGFIHIRLRDNSGKNLLMEEYLQYQWDGVRGMKNRFIGGANIRQKLYYSDKGQFFLGFGLFYEYEEWGLSAVEPALVPTGVSSVSASLAKFNIYNRFSRQLGQVARFSGVFYYQALPETFFEHFRFAGTFQLLFKVGRNLDFTINYDGIYDTKPQVPIRNFYFNVSNQFVWKF
jgi:hypothetical protein